MILRISKPDSYNVYYITKDPVLNPSESQLSNHPNTGNFISTDAINWTPGFWRSRSIRKLCFL